MDKLVAMTKAPFLDINGDISLEISTMAGKDEQRQQEGESDQESAGRARSYSIRRPDNQMDTRNKMINARLLTFGFVVLLSCSAFKSTLSPTEGDELGKVYYFGFEIERITGIPEGQIEEYGCAYRIGRSAFRKTLNSVQQGDTMKYNERDVRAKVVFADLTYFVDYHGVVKSRDGYATIDKAEFVDSLELIGECK